MATEGTDDIEAIRKRLADVRNRGLPMMIVTIDEADALLARIEKLEAVAAAANEVQRNLRKEWDNCALDKATAALDEARSRMADLRAGDAFPTHVLELLHIARVQASVAAAAALERIAARLEP